MLVIAVLRGGPSQEHTLSLKTGAEVLSHLYREPYRAIDVFIDREGVWHVRGIPTTPERALSTVDLVFNALHGTYGEDGTVQKILDRLGVPYTGSGAYASAITQNKILTKTMLEKSGVLMPRHIVLTVSPDLEKNARVAFRAFSPPIVVKPSRSGSSIGVTLVKSFEDFWEGIKEAFTHGTEVMIEEFVPGREASAGIIEGLRKSPYYRMLPVEIGVPTWGIYDRNSKASGAYDKHSPGNFSREESDELQRLSQLVHEELGLKQYSSTDFVVSPHGVYFLEVNSLPTLIPDSSFKTSLDASGVSMDEVLDHMIGRAMKRN